MQAPNPLNDLFKEARPRAKAFLEARGSAERSLDMLQASITAEDALSASAKRQAIAALESDRKSLIDGRRAELAAQITDFARSMGLTGQLAVAKRRRRKPRVVEAPQIDPTGQRDGEAS